MTANQERGMKKRTWLFLFALAVVLPGTGCRQKMSDQPYHKPLEASDMFADGRASRPLEVGVIHRAQFLQSDPLVTGLTSAEWGRVYAQQANPKFDLAVPTPLENREAAVTLPRYDQRVAANPKVYVEEFPFAITPADLERGQDRFTIYCSVCHGALGNGQGKIWERGYLNPTSFHTEIVGTHEKNLAKHDAPKTGLGISRGYALWDIPMPLREAPVGYYFEVITKGYGGMPSYSAQITPADRWRIIAYVRALQFSQHAKVADIPAELKAKVNAAPVGATTSNAGGHP
ncbi:MAG: cytochrome c [Planctomycetes bacterium]|nr:cytochrome c [Planctomycetota bacterium]